MIVICEEYGKKYRVDPKQIKGNSARFKCKSCNHLVLVMNPDGPHDTAVVSAPLPAGLAEAGTEDSAGTEETPDDSLSDLKVSSSDTAKLKGMGLRGKMIILFFDLVCAPC